jgi:hypothetical protein
VDELASDPIRAVTVLSILFTLFCLVLGGHVALDHHLLFAVGKRTLQNMRLVKFKNDSRL